ncbi:hypothetical protein ACQJBY_006171 [Aegilops geniculata]
MAEPTGLAEAFEKLAKIFEESKSGAIVPRQEVAQKIELSPMDMKLEGATNYLSWSRRALLAVEQKELDGHLLGVVAEPGDKTTVEGKRWKVVNSVLIGWLLNSVVPPIGRSVEGLSTSAAIWTTLSTLYSGKGNVMLIAQIEGKISRLHQGDDMSVMTYVAELQALWAEQDNCDPLELYDAACIESGRKWIARRRVLKLLEGLRGCFHGRRASLLHQPLLPSIEETIAAMSQEEVRLSLEHADMKAVPSSTFAVTERMEWSDPNKCHICGEAGHWKWACPTRGRGRGYNGGGTGRGRSARGRGGYSGTSRGQASRGRGGYSGHSGDQRAHMTVAGDTGMSKGKDADDADYGDFALWASTDEGATDEPDNWDWHQA